VAATVEIRSKLNPFPEPFAPFSIEPRPDVCRAVFELDAVCFGAPEKTDNLPIHQCQVFQVPNDAPVSAFLAEQHFQLAQALCV